MFSAAATLKLFSLFTSSRSLYLSSPSVRDSSVSAFCTAAEEVSVSKEAG